MKIRTHKFPYCLDLPQSGSPNELSPTLRCSAWKYLIQEPEQTQHIRTMWEFKSVHILHEYMTDISSYIALAFRDLFLDVLSKNNWESLCVCLW